MSVYELKSENIVRHNLSARGLAITAKVKQYYDVIYIKSVRLRGCLLCFLQTFPLLFYLPKYF